MLDECKGEKFEEVIRVFAIAVLRKEAKQRFGTTPWLSAAFADTLTTPENLTAQQRARLLPLLLAHSQCLRRQLSERNRSHEKFGDLQQRLNEAQAMLIARQKAVEERKDHLPLIKSQEMEVIADHVRTAWSGDERWAELLLHVAPSFVDGSSREQDLRNQNPPLFEGVQQENLSAMSVLADLNQRIEKQEARQEKWKKFHDTLEKARQGRKIEAAVLAKKEPILNFDAHQTLQPSAVSNQKKDLSLRTEQLGVKGMQMIEAMRSELAHLKTRPYHRRESRDKPQSSFSGPASAPTAHEGVEGTTAATHITSGHDIPATEDNAEISESAVLGRHFDQHDAARPFIKSSPASAGRDSYDANPISKLDTFSRISTEEHDDGRDLYLSDDRFETASEQFPGFSVMKSITELEDIHNVQKRSPLHASESLPSSPIPQPADDMTIKKAILPPAYTDSPPPETTPENPSSALSPPPKQRAPTLLERTRQSMALFSTPHPDPAPELSLQAPHPTAKPARPHHRPSQSFPVNPFQTLAAQQQQQQQQAPQCQKQHRKVTPLTQLFSDQADYASVFKSRPRIAVSPPSGTSPERTGDFGVGSGV